ncbi:helix-turn-helix domain-containing protein [Kitasatospora sp. NPDC048722]|uniref:helix-turn-helix domain-containing protein n=1 Tax=Kitasatospora sp. NPDC048722 TaxID=3155639 RepID=UPI0033EF6A2D
MKVDNTRVSTGSRQAERADDILAMYRAARKGGTAQVLRRLAHRTGTVAFLLDRSGTPASPAAPPPGSSAHSLCLRGAREIAGRRLRSVAVDEGGLTGLVLTLDDTGETPLLAVVAPRPAPPGLPALVADAASVLGLAWQAEDVRRRQRRLRAADDRVREAVLQLLMNGQTATARQISGALQPALPEVVQVYVVEGRRGARDEVAHRLAESGGGVWAVPCPVHSDHMIVLAPAAPSLPAWATARPAAAHACRIGVSNAVPLRETVTGYAQAFHALAAARHRADRLATFASAQDLPLTIGTAAAVWADSFLSPLRLHRPRRLQDPDGAELLATAASWLRFSSGAAAHLRIHRNTLAARLASVQELLQLDLARLANRSALALALHAAPAAPHGPDDAPADARPTPALDDLLALPRVEAWAERQLRPLHGPDAPTAVAKTLATWLHMDARLVPTAEALSVSPSAVRKRLARAEVLLQRSLVRFPTAVHDLWLAERAIELAEH